MRAPLAAAVLAVTSRAFSFSTKAMSTMRPDDDWVRSVDSATLLAELSRRGIEVPDGHATKKPRSQSHVVGSLRPKDALSDERALALDAALEAVGVKASELLAGPPLKAYNSFVRPREGSAGAQTVENAAHQIGFLQRHELTRRETHVRNTDAASRAREAAGLRPHDVTIVLDNIRSAENVGSIVRTADCARCKQILTCGFTPHPETTNKIAKTAFGAEAAVPMRHFSNTRDALTYLKEQGSKIWALETVDGSQPYTTAPLPPLRSDDAGGGVAIVLGNEVTGVNAELLDAVDAIVEIPTYGMKNSMNVACCAAVVVFDILRRWEIH